VLELKNGYLLMTVQYFLQNRSGLRQYLDTLGSTSEVVVPIPTAASNDGSTAVVNSNKQDNKLRSERSQEVGQTTQGRLVDLLESTLWNRRLAPTSEDIVNALVAQIFEGIRDHCVAAAEMKVCMSFLR
jgi:hypothetical protein